MNETLIDNLIWNSFKAIGCLALVSAGFVAGSEHEYYRQRQREERVKQDVHNLFTYEKGDHIHYVWFAVRGYYQNAEYFQKDGQPLTLEKAINLAKGDAVTFRKTDRKKTWYNLTQGEKYTINGVAAMFEKVKKK